MTSRLSIAQKGRWNNPEYRKYMSEVHKGRKMPEEQKKKISLALKGKLPKNFSEMQKKGWAIDKREEKNPCWKGKKVGYIGLHRWLYRYLGKPTTCEVCGRTGLTGRFIHWANKSHKYKRELRDWIRICAKCHRRYDGICGKKWGEKIKNAMRKERK